MQGLIPTLGTDPAARARRRAASSRPTRSPSGSSDLGYARADVVEHRGEFAVRGGVVDVFPGTARRPVRLEFFGDEIESLREFVPVDPAVHASAGDACSCRPVRELIPDDAIRARAARRGAAATPTGSATGCSGSPTACTPRARRRSRRSLFDHLPDRRPSCCRRVVGGPRGGAAHARPRRARRTRRRARSPRPRAGRARRRSCRSTRRSPAARAARTSPEFTRGHRPRARRLGHRRRATRRSSPQRLADLAGRGYRLVVTARGHGSLERVQGGRRRRISATRSTTAEAPLANGFVFAPGKLAVATEEDVFGSRRHTRTAPRFSTPPHRRDRRGARARRLRRPPDPRRRPLRRHHAPRARRLRARLPDPRVRAERQAVRPLRSGRHGREVPRRRRARACTASAAPTGRARPRRSSRAVKDMAGELVRLYTRPHVGARPRVRSRHAVAARARGRVPARGDRRPAHRRSRRSSATWSSPKPMDRLICGDVGFGKTEIAVRAAFKAVMEGKQVAVLVPTTILAEQHFITFSERYAPYPVKVKMLSRFVSPAEQKQIARRPREGRRRRRDRHAPADLEGRHVQGPRPAGRRRGAAVRRRAQGAPEAVPRARGRAHHDRDARSRARWRWRSPASAT